MKLNKKYFLGLNIFDNFIVDFHSSKKIKWNSLKNKDWNVQEIFIGYTDKMIGLRIVWWSWQDIQLQIYFGGRILDFSFLFRWHPHIRRFQIEWRKY